MGRAPPANMHIVSNRMVGFFFFFLHAFPYEGAGDLPQKHGEHDGNLIA